MLRALMLSVALMPLPAMAEDGPTGDAQVDEGLGLIERGTRLLFERFLERMEPELENLGEQIEPMLEAFRESLGELDAYHPPEVLPNGDIIIRRKRPGDPPIAPDGDGPIEL